ncbi:MAG: hypothetical protein ED557_09810 [Balneola sp.]|nr:MAG: hypothetical protein ED557_09810 [Balneola sp.]
MDWECTGGWYDVYECRYNSNTDTYYDCRKVGEACAKWTYVEEDNEGGGGAGEDDGFPSDGPGECDPLSTEPCFEDGGGSTPPANPDDPCDLPNPPVWCNCTDTNDTILDDLEVKVQIFNLWADSNGDASNSSNSKEQAMWVVRDPATGEYGISKFDTGFANFSQCGFDLTTGNLSVPGNTVGWVHTQPFEVGEVMYSCYNMPKATIDLLIQSGLSTYIYNGVPSVNDINFHAEIESQTGLNLKAYVVDKNGITEFDENSSPLEIGNNPRHNRTCY